MAMALLSMSAFAQMSPTASTDVYDLSNFGEELVDLFYAAEQNGRKYPTQEEFEAKGFNMMDMAFVRSHVRPRAVLVDQTKNVNQNAYDNRLLWMNIPIGIGKLKGGYPSSNWNDDPYTGWNYTNVFGSWNHGVFHVPGVAVDCAHKNGSDIYAGIKFFESWTAGSGAAGWVGKVQSKDPNGYEGYKYVRPLVNAMMFFGQDGLNYNFEDTGYANADVVGFHQACYKYAKEIGFDNFHIGIYTASDRLSASNVEALFGNNGVKTADAFLNYSGGNFSTGSMRTSYQAAINAMGTCEGVYQGAWIASMARAWTGLDANDQARSIGIVLWGEHGESRLHSNTTGNSAIDYQENYQKLQERLFSGGYRNPAARPTPTNNADWFTSDPKNNALRNFQGVAEYIPERTAIKQNLPFETFFNVGSGEIYNYKGKKTMGNWYNLGQQDVVPTYRWLVYDKGTTTPVTEEYDVNGGVPEFTNADAYIGGSCLRLTNTKAVDIVLYRAELTVSAGSPTVTLALKNFNGATEGGVSVIVKKQGSTTWEETPLAALKGKVWEAQTVSLNGVSKGDVIEYVGLRTSGNTAGTNDSYSLNMLITFSKHSARNILGSLQVYHFTDIFQIVKCPYPVRSYCKDIYVIFFNVTVFLSCTFFDNNLIRKACLFDIFHSGHQTVYNIQLSSLSIVGLSSNPNNQIIPKRFSSLQQSIMSFMKQIKTSVSYYPLHKKSPCTPYSVRNCGISIPSSRNLANSFSSNSR